MSSTEVAIISASGLCGSIPENLEAYRLIRWENILKQSRTGTVHDIVDPACAIVELQAQLLKVEESYNSTREELAEVRRELARSEVVLNETQAKLVVTEEELRNLSLSKCALTKGNLTKWDMLYGPSFYNQILTRDLYTQLRNSWNTISGKN